MNATTTTSPRPTNRKRPRSSSSAFAACRLVGVWKDRLIARLGIEEGEAALLEPYVRAFDITGRPMKKWVAIEPEGVEDDNQLEVWIQRAVKFVGTLPKK